MTEKGEMEGGKRERRRKGARKEGWKDGRMGGRMDFTNTGKVKLR